MPPPDYVAPRLDREIVDEIVDTDPADTNLLRIFADYIANKYPEFDYADRLRAVASAWDVAVRELGVLRYEARPRYPIHLIGSRYVEVSSTRTLLPVAVDSQAGGTIERAYSRHCVLLNRESPQRPIMLLARACLSWLHSLSDVVGLCINPATGKAQRRDERRKIRRVQLATALIPDLLPAKVLHWQSIAGWTLELETARILYGALVASFDYGSELQALRLKYAKAKRDWPAWSATRILNKLTTTKVLRPVDGMV